MVIDDGSRRRLQLVQGLQWLRAAGGDPFAALLRDHDEDQPALYARLRERGPIWRSDTGTWVVARHGAAAALMADPAFEARLCDWRPLGMPVMPLTERDLGLQPEQRAVLSDLARSWVGETALTRHEPRLTTAAGRTLDRFGGEELDLATVAADMSMAMLTELLALPAACGPRLAEQASRAAPAVDSLLCPQGLHRTDEMLTAIDDLRDLFDGQPLHLVLGLVGARICVDLLCNALVALLAEPARWTELRAEPGHVAAIVTETLRYDPPVRVQLMVAVRDTTVHNVTIMAGDQVALLIGPANRDPDVFEAPDTFRPGRPPAPGGAVLVPGWPGAFFLPLARAQAAVALTALVTRFPGLTAAGPVVRKVRAPVSHGVRRLPART
ncbi:P450-derived glycosyltransferase activator [Micromonospora chokoriensis]